MKQLIVNADDFGLSRGINRGIIKAYKEGILSSASLMVNMPGFLDAAGLARECPGLDIGLHLNFYRGRPILPAREIPTLVGDDGLFLQDLFKITKMIYRKKISPQELEAECLAQIQKAQMAGIKLTHIDSEKHLHLIGWAYDVVVKSAKKFNIGYIRNINEYPYIVGSLLNGERVSCRGLGKAALLEFLSSRKKKINSLNHIKTADYSFGLASAEGLALKGCERLFERLKDGTTEIFCHPGYIDDEWLDAPLSGLKYYVNDFREHELEALVSPGVKDALRDQGIGLINFSKLQTNA